MTPLLPIIEKFLRGLTEPVILSFSAGKDSLTCWCILESLGVEVIPFHLHMIPGISFVEDYLDYVEGVFGKRILRCQHPQTYQWIRTYSSQPPHRKRAINLLNLPKFDYPDVEAGVRRTVGLTKAWVAVGTRTTDSPQRRRSFERLGWKREKTRKIYPIFNFRKDDLIETLKNRGVKLPVCYEMYGRSFDGVDFRFIDAIRTDYPEDYQRIKEWMPMQDLEFMRVKFAQKHGIARVT